MADTGKEESLDELLVAIVDSVASKSLSQMRISLLVNYSDIPSGSILYIVHILYNYIYSLEIYSGMLVDILSDIYSDILSSILSGIYSDMLSVK